jgi:hypothetical protein
MKKLKLEALEMSAGGKLTREQLRNVVGGSVGIYCLIDLDCGAGAPTLYKCVNNLCAATGTGPGHCYSDSDCTRIGSWCNQYGVCT